MGGSPLSYRHRRVIGTARHIERGTKERSPGAGGASLASCMSTGGAGLVGAGCAGPVSFTGTGSVGLNVGAGADGLPFFNDSAR